MLTVAGHEQIGFYLSKESQIEVNVENGTWNLTEPLIYREIRPKHIFAFAVDKLREGHALLAAHKERQDRYGAWLITLSPANQRRTLP